MPSDNLTRLCEQIDNSATDHFGKFYMYISLLRTIGSQNKNFSDNLPKYDRGKNILETKDLKIGALPQAFNEQVATYASQFAFSHPTYLQALYNYLLFSVRTGKAHDITYIVDQAVMQLTLATEEGANKNLMVQLQFKENKEILLPILQNIQRINKIMLELTDNSTHALMAMVAIATGLVLILASVFSLVPSIIGLGLIAGSTLVGYDLYCKTIPLIEEYEKVIALLMVSYPKGNKNTCTFFAASVTTIERAEIIAAAQFAPDEEMQQYAQKYINKADEAESKYLNIK